MYRLVIDTHLHRKKTVTSKPFTGQTFSFAMCPMKTCHDDCTESSRFQEHTRTNRGHIMQCNLGAAGSPRSCRGVCRPMSLCHLPTRVSPCGSAIFQHMRTFRSSRSMCSTVRVYQRSSSTSSRGTFQSRPGGIVNTLCAQLETSGPGGSTGCRYQCW